jgi:plastocyanin
MLRGIRLGTIAGAAIGAVALPATAAASTTTVFAGPPPSTGKVAAKLLPKSLNINKFQPDINDFFAHRVTIAQGDSVKFVVAGFHTVDLPGKSGQPLPLLTPGQTASVNDAAGNPFWFSGKLPVLGFNPSLFKPSGPSSYNGTKRIDTGLPFSGPPKPKTVTFTKAGVYKFYCDVHPGMVGFVVVKPKGKTVPSAAQDAAAVGAQIKRDILSAKKLAKTKLPADTVSVGESNAFGLEFYGMFPSTLSVNSGTTVTFMMSKTSHEDHTATFGSTSTLKTLAKGFTKPVLPADGVYPSDPTQPIDLNQTSHGNGFANVGVMDAVAATKTIPSSGKITFTQPGTYHYICLIHPFMRGTIVVK